MMNCVSMNDFCFLLKVCLGSFDTLFWFEFVDFFDCLLTRTFVMLHDSVNKCFRRSFPAAFGLRPC